MIIAVDGKEAVRHNEIIKIINVKKANDTVKVTVIRNGQELTFDVILGQ